MFKRLLLTMLLAIVPVAAHAQGALLVVTKQSHALAIVDGATLQVLARVPIGEDPHEVIVGPDRKTAYISNYGEGTLRTLAVVDLQGQKPLPPIDLTPLRGPHGLTLHNQTLWFTAEGSKALGTLNPATRKVETVLPRGQDKTHLVWVSKDGRKVVASNAGSGTMSIFDRREVKPVTVPGAPLPPASYTAPGWRHALLPVGKAAEGFAVSPDEQELWVGNEDGTISIINLTNEKPQTSLAADVRGANRLKFTPDGALARALTTHTGKDRVVIDAHTRKRIKRIPIEQRGASGIQVQPDSTRAFVACPRDHYVAVVDLASAHDDRKDRRRPRAGRPRLFGSLNRRRVIFAIRSEDVQHLGILLRGSLVHRVARNQETIPGLRLKNPAGILKREMAANDIHHLLMRMAMPGAHPTKLHPVPHQHHVRTPGHDLPPEPRLGVRHRFILRSYNLDCRHPFSSIDLHTIIHLGNLR